MFDIDGNEYIDYVLGFGPMLLGHCPPSVVEAVTKQLRRGFTFGAQHELEADVAERIVATVPCAELACFASTGSEADAVALRLARAFTGRRLTIKFEGHYHGWLDPVFVSIPGLQPAPPEERVPLAPRDATLGQSHCDDVLVARWNDPAGVEELLQSRGDDIAAVLMEPVASNGGLIEPATGFLGRIRELCDSYGVILIFDEVVTGYRLALGGAQEHYDVTPDLATFGKAIGGGMPLSAVAGRGDILELIADGRVKHVGTFNGSPPAAAAARAALDAYMSGAPTNYDQLNDVCGRLADGLMSESQHAGVPLRIHRVGPLLQTIITASDEPIRAYHELPTAHTEAFAVFTEEMLARGVMILPRGWWFLSMEHSEADIDSTVAAAHEAFAATAERCDGDW